MNIHNILNANIPLISVQTNDILHISSILQAYASTKKKKSRFIDCTSAKNVTGLLSMLSGNTFGFLMDYDPEENKLDMIKLYRGLDKEDKVLVLVNSEYKHDSIYDVGFLGTPPELIANKLSDLLEDQEVAYNFVPLLKDLSLKQIEDILKLCSHKFGSISEETILITKRGYSNLPEGLHSVSTDFKFYHPIPMIEDWIKNQGRAFHKDIPIELKPKGLLLYGVAGSGKTMSAKRIAASLKVPLYRLDVGSLMNKYVGESERNLNKALHTLESASPCTVLIDEVEKLFNMSEDSGTGSRILSQLLWWLQEDTSEIVTIMTTNDKSAIPPELYRAGRIDKSIEYFYLAKAEAVPFAQSLLEKYAEFVDDPKVKKGVMSNLTDAFAQPSSQVTYASITELVFAEIRKYIN